jgi:hypothetical protein
MRDNSGVARAAVVIFQGRRALDAGFSRWGRVRRGVVYYLAWPVPRKAPHRLRFCMLGEDRAHNQSKVTCAPLTIS